MIPKVDSSTNQGQCFALCPFCILQPFKSIAITHVILRIGITAVIPIVDSGTNKGKCFALCPFCILQPFKSKAITLVILRIGITAVIPFGDSGTNQGQCFTLCPFCILQPFKSKAFGVFGYKKGRPPACPCLAERKGFEPSMQLPTYKLSRLAPSTTRTPLYLDCKSGIFSGIIKMF